MFTIKRGDTRYALKAILKDGDGIPVDLNNCDVSFIIKGVMERTPYIHDAVNGEVWVVFHPEDTANEGYYIGEFKVVYSDNRIETFPNEGFIRIHITESLGGTN